MRKLLSLLPLGLVILAASPAIGGYLAHSDPNDTESRIDIRSVRLVHRHDPNAAIIVIRRYDRHYPDVFGLHAYFDSRGGPRADHRVDIGYDFASGGWYLCDIRARGHGHTGSCAIRERDRTIRVEFRWRLLDPNKPLRWRLQAETDGNVVDRAPDEGFYSS